MIQDSRIETRKISAAIVQEKGAPFVFEELELEGPRPDEILVRIVATGICQTDVHVRDRLQPAGLPAVLGHEGAGVVEEVGNLVTAVKPGDPVVLSYEYCDHCRFCRTGRYSYCEKAMPANFGGSRLDGTNALRRSGGGPVHGHFFGQSSFATYAVATERNTVKVPSDLPLELLGPLGCGLQTGAGAVLNSLRVPANSGIAILGTGAVGLAAIMAARIAGANPIIGVDIIPSRLQVASELGATHTIDARKEDVRQRVAEITGSGVDYALEITAIPEMLKLAVDILAPCGTAGLIGGGIPGAEAPIRMSQLLLGRTVRGIVQGDSIPQLFIPKLIAMYRAGKFPFDRLVRFYDFKDINRAIADSGSGVTIKPVLRISSP